MEQQRGDWRNKMLSIHKKVSSSAERMRNFGKAACYGTSGGNYDNKKGDIPICDYNEEGILSIHKKHSSSSAERMRNFGNAAYYGKRNINNYDMKKQVDDIIASSPDRRQDRLRNFDKESREILTLLQQCRRRLYDSSKSAEIEPVPDIDDDDLFGIDEADVSPSTATYLKNLLKKQEISTGW